jgi:hypothetical protein
VHVPLRPRHLVTVLPPLAVLGGIGVALWWEQAQRPGLRRARRKMIAAATAVFLVASAIGAALLAPTRNFVATHPLRGAAIDFLRARTAPGDCVVAKENRFYFVTRRLPPPFLSEVSTARLYSGLLTGEQVMDEIERHDCAALVYDDSFDDLAPTLAGLAQDYYSLRLTLAGNIGGVADDEPIMVYAVPRQTDAPPSTAVGADLGGLVTLAGYDLTPGPWTRGQTVYLSTYWQVQRPVATDYRIFVHLTDATGALVDNFDHWPYEPRAEFAIADAALHPAYLAGDAPADYPNAGLIPTHVWQPGQMLKETIAFTVGLPPGQYTLQVGLFDPTTGERLEVPDSFAGGDANQIVLTTVEAR